VMSLNRSSMADFFVAAGPKPVDQYPDAVIARGRFICSLQSDIGSGNALAHLRRSGQ
jgi:hypothetical protein